MRNKTIQYIGMLVFLFLAVGLSAQSEKGQQIIIPLSEPGEAGRLKISLLHGSITVVAHQGKDVIIETTNRISSKSQKTRGGLRKISDTSLEFSVEEYNNKVVVKSKKVSKVMHFLIKVPVHFSLNLRVTNSGDINVNGVTGEFEVSNLNGAIRLIDISGSVIADALNKDIVVTFKDAQENMPMAFTSLNGDLDITFPKGFKAAIKAKTDNGEMFTDFDINITQKYTQKSSRTSSGVYKVNVDKWITGAINGGGAELLFKTMNGDILLRSN